MCLPLWALGVRQELVPLSCGLELSGLPGQVGNPPNQFLIESFGTESSGDPDSEGPDLSFSLVCEDKAEVRTEVGLLKESLK